jgi:Family of unknown function (DUF6291)
MKNENTMKPKGIYFKTEWNGLFNELEDAAVGRLIKNVYNYLDNRELIEMDKAESLLFKFTIVPVLDYNQEKYNQKVEHNRSIASKGGRKAKESSSPMGFSETRNIPQGFFTNPENPKDRDKEKVRDKEIDRSKVKEYINKMKKLVDLDLNSIHNSLDANFCIRVKELVRILDWARFELLVFHTNEGDIENLLLEFDKPGCIDSIKDIRSSYALFLDKLIK